MYEVPITAAHEITGKYIAWSNSGYLLIWVIWIYV